MVHGETMVRALSEESFEMSKRLVEGLIMALNELEDFAFQLQNGAWQVILVKEGSYDVLPCENLL